MRAWTVRDCLELYNVPTWGAGFFSINAKGHMEVQPRLDGARIDPVSGQIDVCVRVRVRKAKAVQ